MARELNPFLQRVMKEVEKEVDRSAQEEGANARSGPAPEEPWTELENQEGDIVGAGEALEGMGFPATELRDRVTIMLLFVQVVEARHVERAWRQREQLKEQGEEQDLWRLLAEDPELDTETIYREAARLYSFEEAQIEKLHALSVLREIKHKVSEEQWERMRDLLLLPIEVENHEETNEPSLVFATHDPMRASVHRFIEEMGLRHSKLRYAPESLLENLLGGLDQSDISSLLTHDEVGLVSDLEEEVEEPPSTTEDPASREPSTEDDESVSRETLVDLFETALVEAVQKGANAVRLYPNAHRQAEILLEMDDHLLRWHVEERVPPEVFLTVVKEKVRKRKSFSQEQPKTGRFIQRWIDQQRVRFQVSIRPITNERKENLLNHITLRRLLGD